MKLDLCPNCFEAGYQNGSCSRCGYKSAYNEKYEKRSLPAGTMLKQRYYIGRVLGEGGFGITYKVFDTQKNIICAVKEYAPNGLCFREKNGCRLELTSRENDAPYMAGLNRFLEESRILSRLEQIPSVVDITDTFQENNTAYFVMEYLNGADLRQIVKASKQQIPVDQITDVILQVAVSMDVIHTKTKIIHRDISPENIYITRDGKVKLIDFGSAKRTETGMKKGLSVVLKPKFAPPEQFSSEMVQGSFTDVYSLASTYYYALTGIHVPPAPDRLAGKNYVPLKQMNPGIPEGISDAVDHALVLNVRQRTPSMQVFIAEIAASRQASGGKAQAGGGPAKTPSRGKQSLPGKAQAPVKPAAPARPPVPRPVPSKPSIGKRVVAEFPYVTVLTGVEAGKNWVLPPNQPMIFGRSMTEAHLRVQYPEDVSRVHCKITYLADIKKFSIRDLSVNGVFFKGRRLQRDVDYQVKPPARFSLSGSSCIIEVGVKYEYR